MQPLEPAAGPVQQPGAPLVPAQPGPGGAMPPAAPAAGKPRNRRARLWLAMGAGIVALLCLGGVGIFVSLYDRATRIERSAPDAVVDGFLRAYFVSRDDEEVALFTCRRGPDLTAVKALRDEITSREENFDVTVMVSWASLTIAGSGDQERTVATDLTIAGTSGGVTRSRRTEPWTFTVVEDDGWRVCSAAKQA